MPAAIGRPGDDPAARLGTLFDQHHQRLFRLARRLSRSSDDAHDVVQETFLRAARSPQSIPHGPSSEEAWLVRVLINICRDRWRATSVRLRAIEMRDVEAPENPDPERSLLAKAMVQHALQQLPPRRRAILVLYEIEGVAIKDIASMLKMNAVTVRWHLSVGRREMAKMIGERRTR